MPAWAWGTLQGLHTGGTIIAEGPLGIGDATARPLIPTLMALPPSATPVKISSNGAATAILTADGSVYMCGRNGPFGTAGGAGFLGQGTIDSSPHPSPVLVASLAGIVDISCGNDCVLALTATGDLFGWGSNILGSLGLGDTLTRSSPTLLHTLVAEARAGDTHSVIHLNDGSVLTAGLNNAGQLARSTNYGTSTPAPAWGAIAGTAAIAHVFAGAHATLFIASDGTVLAAGGGSFGQLGFTIYNNSGPPIHSVDVPTTVPNLSNIVSISNTARQTYFLDAAGVIYMYGQSGTYGASGDGTTGTIYGTTAGSPTVVLMPVTAASLANNDTGRINTGDFDIGLHMTAAALGVDGQLYTWGFGYDGSSSPILGAQPGSGADALSYSTPVSISGLRNLSQVAITLFGMFAVSAIRRRSQNSFAQVVG